MTALKHLLNHDDDTAAFDFHRPSLAWEDSGYFGESEPILPMQSWDQLAGEIFGAEEYLTADFSESGFDSDAFRSTQSQIEEWITADVTQVSAQNGLSPTDIQICYGTIFRAAIKLCGNMAELDKRMGASNASPIEGHALLNLELLEDQYFVTFADKVALGEVNASLGIVLTSISKQQGQINFQVFAPVRATRETIARATNEKDAVVRVQINVYGPESIASSVGREFSLQKLYFQRPDFVREGIAYDNPHVLKIPEFDLPDPEITVNLEMNPMDKVATNSLKDTMSDVYSSLTRNKTLKGLEADERLRTPLLVHQKTALDFMMQRENGPIPESYRLWQPSEVDGQPCYRHVVTNKISRVEPPETGGGILADEMGMGKSLSVLALILRTLKSANDWAFQTEGNTPGASWTLRRRSTATLIVASSDLMINEWFSELDKHFASGTWKLPRTVKYHGQKRECISENLWNADIVITTYHTLASENARSKTILHDIEWFRLVLDEAHIIRRQATVLYQTVASLSARARWCLTGTPVQNKLEDIGSLLAFLRLEPFHSLSTFRNSIVLPFEDRGNRRECAIEKFTRLLDSTCLRRTKDLLHLPDQQNHVRLIRLSSEERYQYDQTSKTMFRAVRHQNGVRDQKSTLGMFQVQLQLRILCNHGTWQQPFSWNRRKQHLLDEREAMEVCLGGEGGVTCSVCKQTLPLFGTGTMFQRYEECRHVLCSECVEENTPQNEESIPTKCPLCKPLWNASKGVFRSKHTIQEDMYFQSSGRSAKMDALMADVMIHVAETKSIIFTCWTRTLNLIEIYLKGAGLCSEQFQRIDGDCPTTKREKILNEFARNSNLRVLIMTTGTGAVGLNLATANRVFIVEPQWNPSVENQAIARALRIGQKQPVQVTRYLVEQTVEQDMRTLQDKKMERANLVKNS